MIRDTTGDLPVPEARVMTIAGLAGDVAAHDAHVATIPAMTMVETGGQAGPAPLALPFRLAAWNLERCLFPEASVAKVADCDVVVLSEMDRGMARTAQRHTTAEMAAGLGMAYAYAVEFLELGLGSDTEREFCTDDRNTHGFHGNGLMARTALTEPWALRLWGTRQWTGDAGQPRLGERIAVGAKVATEQGPVLLVSTHLESACGAAHRERQVAGLIAAIDAEWPGLPCLIGGDLNTGNHADGDWRAEGLFDRARDAGFTVHGGPDDAATTRPSLITRWPDRAMKLDWVLARGLTLAEAEIRSSLDPDGRPLSDHDAIVVDVLAVTG